MRKYFDAIVNRTPDWHPHFTFTFTFTFTLTFALRAALTEFAAL